MAGTATHGGTIATNEPLGSLGPKLSQLLDDATFSGFSDTEAGSEISIPQGQASAPTAVDDDFWLDTVTRLLRVYEGASSQKAWQAFGEGLGMLNNTGTIRAAGDVVGATVPSVANLAYNAGSGNKVVGVVQESTADGAFGLVRFAGRSMVKISGTVTRGDFLKFDLTSGNRAVSAGTTLAGTFGMALTSGVSGGTVSANLRGYNG